jgi:L-alanine-DL-glutamate epimerase-like enolase superfamily enzyme
LRLKPEAPRSPSPLAALGAVSWQPMSTITAIETYTAPNRLFSLCRVRTDDGLEGLGQLARGNADIAAMVLHRQIAPHALGRDVDHLPSIIQSILDLEAKFQGTYLCRALAGLDTAVWDLLGKRAGLPVYRLLGGRPEPLAVYGSSMARDTSVQQEVDALLQARQRFGYQAFKFKVGKRRGHDQDQFPGRSEALIAHARRALGPDVRLMVDANSCYSPPRAIEIGKLLQDHGYTWFEEPCPHLELEQTAEVAAALDIPVAGGEQDWDLAQFRRMIALNAVDIVQYDVGYVGGFTRALAVADLARQAGKRCVPHSANDSMILPISLHLLAAIDNAADFAEYNIINPSSSSDLYCDWQPLVRDGRLTLPTGPGWGLTANPAWLAAAHPQRSAT